MVGLTSWQPSGDERLLLAASNFLLFPLVSKRVPSTTLFQVCSGLSAVIIASTPLIAPIGGRFPSLLMPLLLLHSSVKEFCSSTCFTAVFLVINNSCTKGQRGRVNGLGMSLSSAFKAVGPTLGSVSFAWSLTNGYGFPLDVHFTFLLCGIFAAATCAVACRSFSPLNDKPLAAAAAAEPAAPAAPADDHSGGLGGDHVAPAASAREDTPSGAATTVRIDDVQATPDVEAVVAAAGRTCKDHLGGEARADRGGRRDTHQEHAAHRGAV